MEETKAVSCPNCEAANPEGNRFCSDCGSPVRQGEFLRHILTQELDKRFRDRGLVEIDVAQSISDRLVRHLRVYATLGAVVIAILAFMGFQTYSDFATKIQEAEQRVASQTDEVVQEVLKAQESAKQAQVVAQNARSVLNEEIANVRGAVKTFENDTQGMRSKATQIVANINKLESDLSAQKKKLETTDELVREVARGTKTEQFLDGKSGGRMLVVEQEPRKVSVYVLLDDVPIHESLQLQWHLAVQPVGSYVQKQNLVGLRWADTAARLTEKALSVRYFADKSAAGPRFKTLTLKDGHVFADATDIPLLFSPAAESKKE